jgi:hypothetical protein
MNEKNVSNCKNSFEFQKHQIKFTSLLQLVDFFKDFNQLVLRYFAISIFINQLGEAPNIFICNTFF